MEFGGNNNGGFHGYKRQIPQGASPTPTTGKKVAEMSIGLPTQANNSSDDNNECSVREQDRFMPIANVIRIMRKILPPHAKISDDAKESIQECVSEYISFITGEANDRCQREQRKTITAEDVLWAMSKLGFDDYIEPLTMYLHRYREFDGGDRGSMRGEPLMKRPAAATDHGGYGIAFAPAFHVTHHHHGYYGPTIPMNGVVGTSQVAVSNLEPFAQSKE